MNEQTPVNPSPEEPKHNWFTQHKAIGYGLLVLALILIGGLAYLVYPKNFRLEPNPQQNPATNNNQQTKLFAVSNDFPFYARDAITFDSQDKNILWLSFNGAIVKYNLLNDTWETVLTGVKGLDNSPWTLAHKGDNIYFSLFQGGFEKINLMTGQHKVYTSDDGLSNNGNIVVYDDPGTDDIWIATFNGLSRFNTATEKFTNYTTQLGNGSAWSIHDVVVNKNFVWVNIGGNCCFKGGIARYDKSQNSWKTWGPQDFGGQQYVYISYGMDALNDKAIAEVDTTGNLAGDKIMQYDPQTYKWIELFKRPTSHTFYRDFTYVGGKVYFLDGDKLKYYDSASDKILTTNIVGQSGYETISKDYTSERLVFLDRSSAILYDPKTNQSKQLKISQPEKFVDKLLTSDDQRIVFSNGRNLVVHEFSTNKDTVINTSQYITESYEGKIIGDYLLVVSPAFQEMDDLIPGDIILVNLKNYSVEKNLVVNDYYFDTAFVGKNVSEIFIGAGSYTSQDNNSIVLDSIKKYDFNNNLFNPQELKDVDIKTLNQVLSTGIPAAVNGKNSAEIPFNPIHNNQIKVNISYNGISDSKTFDLPSKEVDSWFKPVETTAYAIEFDTTNPNYIWIGTSQGLLLYDLASQKQQLYKEADGLISNSVKKIISLSDGLVLEDETGAYRYQVDYSRLLH